MNYQYINIIELNLTWLNYYLQIIIFIIFPESQLPFRFFLIREVNEEWRDFINTTKRLLLLIKDGVIIII